MGANFVGASTQYLAKASSAVGAYPFSMGCWVRPTTSAAITTVWANYTSGSNYWCVFQWDTNQWNAQAHNTVDVDCLAGTVTSGSWHYLVARFISATNRRLAVLNANGTISHAQSVTSSTPAATNEHIGEFSSLLMTGQIAEFWTANIDIQTGGGQLQDSTVHKLAYTGPFSVPGIVGSMREYHSFYSSTGSDTEKLGEVYWGAKGAQTWTNTGGVTTSFHPPLFPEYVRPADKQTLLIV